jgi:hypothetical protein
MSVTSTSPNRKRDSAPLEPSPVKTDPRISVRMLALVSLVSLCSFLWFFFRHEILLYGDAVAHINIARRVFDCIHPGLLRLGTVWLPLPHLLIIPFIVNQQMWTTGWGASIPSIAAYILGVIGIYKLVFLRLGKWPALLAAAIYGLNPNLLYLQSTAMTEPIFLVFFIWSFVYLDRYLIGLRAGDSFRAHHVPHKSLEYCAIALAASMLTRYDGWVYSAVFGIVVLVSWWRWQKGSVETADAPNMPQSADAGNESRRVARSLIAFMLLCALTGALWLAQNYALSGRPLDFINGPYSAKAIDARSMHAGSPPHPGTGSLLTSAIFFLKDAKLNVSGGWLDTPLFLIAVAGVLLVFRYRALKSFLLLLLPIPFYAYSVAYGSVPIFMPVWWPHSYYNVRYGIELLPAFAVFIAVALYAIVATSWRKELKWAAEAALIVIVAGSYVLVAAQSPISLREARVNSITRVMLERRLAEALRQMPPRSIILMETVDYVGALQRAGIPLHRVIWEGAHTQWEESLADPAKYADYVVAFRGDEVWYATRRFPQHLVLWVQFDTPGKPRVSIYKVEK